jgi:hypothetical protein
MIIAECHPERPGFARNMCKPCYQRWWRNVSKPTYYADMNAKIKYGLLPIERDQLLANGICNACGAKPKKTKLRNLVIDHDHTTGKVRGVLCRRCNVLLAVFENPKWRNIFTDYLEGSMH